MARQKRGKDRCKARRPLTYIRVKIRPENDEHKAAWEIVDGWIERKVGAPNLVQAILLLDSLQRGEIHRLYELFPLLKATQPYVNGNGHHQSSANSYRAETNGSKSVEEYSIRITEEVDIDDDTFRSTLLKSLGI